MRSGIRFSVGKPTRKEIAGRHDALRRLGLPTAPDELRACEIRETTRAAVRELGAGRGRRRVPYLAIRSGKHG